MKGIYCLIIKVKTDIIQKIGALGKIKFKKGIYVYIGSAQNNLEKRIKRHLSKKKKIRWHIDYLLQKASITKVILCETADKIECAIAQALSRQFDSIPGFGSSDCRCKSHLFFAADNMKPTILATLRQLDIRPELAKVGY